MTKTIVDQEVYNNIHLRLRMLGIPGHYIMVYPEKKQVKMYDSQTISFKQLSDESILLLYNSTKLDLDLYRTLRKIDIDIESIVYMISEKHD